jgi:flagellum-specific peptidoglycan hydrolase FlgJ/LysM repeat protein
MTLLKKTPRHAILHWSALFAFALLLTNCTASKQTAKNSPTPYGNTTARPSSAREQRLAYIDRYKGIAISEMQRVGVPASIKLAQGVLESGGGTSNLSREANNHFGIKCHADWDGATYYREDDDYGADGKLIKSCFRVYNNPNESYIAHSEFLRDPKKVNRYGFLFQLDQKDYIGWAKGLNKAGYATASDYADKLINVIEDYQLYQYDNLTVSSSNANNGSNNGNNNGGNNGANNNNGGSTNPMRSPDAKGIFYNNDVKAVLASNGVTMELLSGRYNVQLNDLLEYNDFTGAVDQALPEKSIVYLQSKNRYYHPRDLKYHIVQYNERMVDISQRYGIRVAKLYSKNDMDAGTEPAVGEKLILRRGWFEGWTRPKLRDPNSGAPSNQPNNNGKKRNDGGLFEIEPGNANPLPNTNNGSRPPSGNNNDSYPTTPDFEQPNAGNNSGNSGSNNSYPTTNYPTTTYPSEPTTTYPSSSEPTYPSTTEPTYPSTSEPTYPTSNPEPNKPYYPPVTKPSTPTAPRPSPPTATPNRPRPSTPPTATPSGNAQYHTVAAKETLWAISRKYQTTVANLKQLNGLTSDALQIGQNLRVK